MKNWTRLLALLALVAVMLLTMSAAMAEDAETHEHFAYCTKPDICAVCGETLTNGVIRHNSNYTSGGQRDEDTCWKKCSDCNQIVGYTEHLRWCDGSVSFCVLCGADYDGDNIMHSSVDCDYVRTETKHAELCSLCGITLGWGDHRFSDDNPDVCKICGWSAAAAEDCKHKSAKYYPYNFPGDFEKYGPEIMMKYHKLVCDDCGTVLEDMLEHEFGDYYPLNNRCARTCEICGFVDSGFPHQPSCDGGPCHICGFDCTEIMDELTNFWHDHQTSVEIDDQTHRRSCTCGVVDVIEKHVVDEDNPSVCRVCGAKLQVEEATATPDPTRPSWPGTPFTPEPAATATPEITEAPEVTEAPETTEAPEVTEEPETTEVPETTEAPKKDVPTLDNDLGKLAIVDEDGEVVDYTGFETFEGAEFYFEDGVIRDDMDGLTLINGTWRNMEHGRFNTGDGMVFFEGAAFLVKGGLVDEGQSGLIDYNGQRFVFSYGQFQPSVYGAWPDPISGRFVYVWAGQFYPITDLVSYNDHVFYFIDGYLATDFTGVVKDFQGTEFNIIGGQAY